MDAETAQALLSEGAVLVVQDLPVGTEFGLDYNSWHVGPRFRGVKMVPPGPHFIFTSATQLGRSSVDDDGRLVRRPETAPRTGTFRVLERRQVAVYRWDAALEDLVPGDESPEALERYRANLRDMDPFLGAYPFDHTLKRWLSLTNFVTGDVVARLVPRTGRIASVTVHQPAPAPPDSAAAAADDAAAPAAAAAAAAPPAGQAMELDPTFANLRWARDSASAIQFVTLPERPYPPGAPPDLVTRYSMDKSYVLQQVLDQTGGQEQLLGELQFAFVTFLIGQVFDGFEHWKLLVALLCNCDEALTTHPKLFLDFIGK